MNISLALQNGLKAKHMTQAQLVRASGIPRTTVNEYVLGKRNPKPDILKKLFDALDIDLNQEGEEMNVKFDQLNTADVARILKVTASCVSAWCRKGYIRGIDISDEGTSNARWLISEEELARIQRCREKHGRNWLMYSMKELQIEDGAVAEEDVKEITYVSDYTPPKQSADKISILYGNLQQAKEELENIEARRNQLINEINNLRNEIVEML